MLTIRIDKETKNIIAYLRLHKVRFTGRLKSVIIEELHKIADDFKYKSNCPF
ncbi:hypothetical protein RPMD05_24 [Rhodobacteraceae phage LS06-2018-MD05]|nr:hypothetical protein RPMD05_24 [Rhodobacteraceae phage LS06-2018-MD05]